MISLELLNGGFLVSTGVMYNILPGKISYSNITVLQGFMGIVLVWLHTLLREAELLPRVLLGPTCDTYKMLH